MKQKIGIGILVTKVNGNVNKNMPTMHHVIIATKIMTYLIVTTISMRTMKTPLLPF